MHCCFTYSIAISIQCNAISDLQTWIGIRSGVGSTDWKWSNGNEVNNNTFPSSTLNVCQQMVLQFDKRWKLEPKDCMTNEAKHVCQMTCKVTLKSMMASFCVSVSIRKIIV